MSATPRGCSACTNTGCCGPASGPREIATLRSYLRQRERLLEGAAAHIQHMQKALTEMNLQLHHVVTDITGVTGLRILRALVAGERDPDQLAAYRDPHCKAPIASLRAALVGNDREEHVFALGQALELYDVYQAKVAACDQRIEAVLERVKAVSPPPAAPLPPLRPTRRQANEPGFAVREALHATQCLFGRGLIDNIASAEQRECAEARAPQEPPPRRIRKELQTGLPRPIRRA